MRMAGRYARRFCWAGMMVWLIGEAAGAELVVSPQTILLDRPEGSQQVLVTEQAGSQRIDLSRTVDYAVANPAIARAATDGLIQPLSDGRTELVVRWGRDSVMIPIVVTGLQQPAPVSFRYEVQPILTKSRCNSGGCHGKAEGQNGFKLSLFGFDHEADYEAVVNEARGRRIDPVRPDDSLLLLKGAARVPHGGGLKLDRNSSNFKLLQRWVHEGAPVASPADSPVVRIDVEPAELVMTPHSVQQLRVTAVDAGGRSKCVTVEADYISNAAHVVSTTPRGLMETTDVPGAAAILIRYLDQVAVCRITVPRPNSSPSRPTEKNFIDQQIGNQLVRLGISPSLPIDDAVFLRRVSFDTIGTLPTADEARRFLTDPSPDKRSHLVRALLDRPEYADYWAMKWANLLRADKIKITPQGTVGMTRWLRGQFAANRPYDALVRDIITAQGPVPAESPAGFYKALDTPEVAARSVSQLFLGVRIECAQCHHHPSERWSQSDYAGFVGFFTGLSVKRLPIGTETILAKAGNDHNHPRTGEPVPTRALGAEPARFHGVADRRQVLADWMTAPDNPFLAKAIVNRLWAHYFGRGLIEPIDDIRVTNPATNEPLMEALIAHLKEVKYDLKAFTTTLVSSQTYQLSSVTRPENADDTQHFSHALPKALPAEVLLDAVCQATDVPEKFNGWPEGYRSIQVWDNRMPSYFFRIFGRPVRASVCECERSNEPSISQALHLLNSPEVNEKIRHKRGRVRQLANAALSDNEVIDEIYLATLSRFPAETERNLLLPAFSPPGIDRRQAVEDVFWAVLNTKEFLYNQ